MFRKIWRDEKLENYFKSNCYGYFFDLLEDNNACFLITMIYGLLKCKIKYKGDDEELKDEDKKMDAIWINYCGMPVVHTYLVPTKKELEMPSFLTLGIVERKPDPKKDLIKRELAEETTIKREATREDLGTGAGGDGIGGGVGDVGVRHSDKNGDDAHENLFQKRVDHDDSYTECKNRYENLIKSINALAVTIKELTSKRGVTPSRKLIESFSSLEVQRSYAINSPYIATDGPSIAIDD
ncbi:hypothetical protein FXO37_26560 [Capsicum annuum]|nr:hypothetical protein FXO37_26560 [Capsicum annuum]